MTNESIIDFIRRVFNSEDNFVPLHAPIFNGNEKQYVLDTIDSTFVSSVGNYVNAFEKKLAEFTGAKYAVAVVNGTTALHLSLLLAGVKAGDEVLTQPLTFVATSNAIVHAGGVPVFIDVDIDSMGLSPVALKKFLEEATFKNGDGECISRKTGNRIKACVPMHTFGFPGRIDEIVQVCSAYNIAVVEDAAESLGSYYKGKHTGTYGLVGTFSFNGNKIMTCGAGGAIVTDDDAIAKKAKHLSTTAKIPHEWDFIHDEVAYNYRMPNLNAAVACAQIEQLDSFIRNKHQLSQLYAAFFEDSDVKFVQEIDQASANFWLNTIIFPDRQRQQSFLKESNAQKVMTRPVWELMNKLDMYKKCQTGNLVNAEWLAERVVNIPSSVRLN